MSNEKTSQVFCQECNQTLYVRIDMTEFNLKNPDFNGLIQKTLVHDDHVILCDIDTHGNIRGTKIISILRSPMETLANDIAMAFYFVNIKGTRPLHLDVFSSNKLLKKFTNSIITEMFNISNEEHKVAGSRIIISSYKNSTTLSGDRLTISLGPFVLQGLELLENPHKGLLLDTSELAKSGKTLEDLLPLYDWVVVLLSTSKPTEEEVKIICAPDNIEYYYGKLNNQGMAEAFDFISIMAMEKYG